MNSQIADRTRPVWYFLGGGNGRFLEAYPDGQRRQPLAQMRLVSTVKPSGGTPNQTFADQIAMTPVAATYGERTCIYTIYGDKLVRWEFPAAPLTPPDQQARLTPAGESFPARAAEGKKLAIRILPPGSAATMTLMEPEGAELFDGIFTWTPAAKDVGKQRAKFKLVQDGQTTFLRYETEVVDARTADVSAGATGQTAPAGRHAMTDPRYHLAHAWDGKSMLLLHGCRLSILDRDGQCELRHIDLPHYYQFIVDRPEYYLLISNRRAEIVDKQTFKVLRTMNLPFTEVADVTAHPSHAATFVSGYMPWVYPATVFRINEAAGTAWRVPDFFVEKLALSRDGKILYGATSRGNDLFRTVTGHAVLGCDVSTADIRRLPKVAPLPPTRDGSHVGTLGVGLPIPWQANDYVITQLYLSHHRPSRTPMGVAIHPTLPKLAMVGLPKGLSVYTTPDGRVQEDALPQDAVLPAGIHGIYFTPGGRHLVLDCRGEAISTVPLNLSPAERRILDAAETKPASAVNLLKLPPDPPFGTTTVPEKDLDSLTKQEPTGTSPANSIGKMVRKDKIETGGFFVGKDGYFLTLARALPLDHDPMVEMYAGRDAGRSIVRRPAKILYVNYTEDLALLKADGVRDAHSVVLNAPALHKDQTIRVYPTTPKGESVQTLPWEYIVVRAESFLGDDMDLDVPYDSSVAGRGKLIPATPVFDEKGRMVFFPRKGESTRYAGISPEGIRRFLLKCAER